jgi:hypothetical protein
MVKHGEPAKGAGETDQTSPRAMTPAERALVARLIEGAPDHRRQLLEQLAEARVLPGCDCGCGSFRIVTDGSGLDQGFVVSEGFVEREGRTPIGVLLSTARGRLSYVEVYDVEARDGDPPMLLPAAADITF